MIVKLKPALKSYLWGGKKLINEWNKTTYEETVSEAWELSFNPESPSCIASGPLTGTPLHEVATRADWGENCARFRDFPVLNKLIDAELPLSIQVHPSDGYALEHEGQFGKTEMWHILQADEGAFLYLGFNKDITAEQFGKAVADGSITKYLNKVFVKAGETYFIPSGTVHAINGGITLFEIQQNSTLTYRVFDYNRKDANGNTRELHVEKAKVVTNLSACAPVQNPTEGVIGKCEYFTVRLCRESGEIGEEKSFVSVTVTDGRFRVGDIALGKGETLFVSAGERARIEGSGVYIVTSVE